MSKIHISHEHRCAVSLLVLLVTTLVMVPFDGLLDSGLGKVDRYVKTTISQPTDVLHRAEQLRPTYIFNAICNAFEAPAPPPALATRPQDIEAFDGQATVRLERQLDALQGPKPPGPTLAPKTPVQLAPGPGRDIGPEPANETIVATPPAPVSRYTPSVASEPSTVQSTCPPTDLPLGHWATPEAGASASWASLPTALGDVGWHLLNTGSAPVKLYAFGELALGLVATIWAIVFVRPWIAHWTDNEEAARWPSKWADWFAAGVLVVPLGTIILGCLLSYLVEAISIVELLGLEHFGGPMTHVVEVQLLPNVTVFSFVIGFFANALHLRLHPMVQGLAITLLSGRH